MIRAAGLRLRLIVDAIAGQGIGLEQTGVEASALSAQLAALRRYGLNTSTT